jgi:hypothetical protein
VLQEFELVDEGDFRVEGAGEAHRLRYRYFSDDGDMTFETKVIATQGPLVCELTLTGLDGPDEERDKLFDAIIKTFSLHDMDFLAKPESIQLLPKAAASDGTISAADGLSFPRACVALQPPKGWDQSEKDGDAIFTLGNARIRLHRPLKGQDANTWLMGKMAVLQESGSRLLASENGETWNGSSYTAVLFDPGGAQRTWDSAAEARILNVLVEDQQLLERTLECPRDSFASSHPAFQQAIVETRFLEPGHWQTKLAEPWTDLTLEGGWRAEGEGLYVNMDHGFVFIHLSALPCKVPLDHLSPAVLENVRGGFETIHDEDQALGRWHEMDSFRLSLEGEKEGGQRVHVRTAWIAFDEKIYSVMVQGVIQGTVDSLFTRVLEGLRIASAASRGS